MGQCTRILLHLQSLHAAGCFSICTTLSYAVSASIGSEWPADSRKILTQFVPQTVVHFLFINTGKNIWSTNSWWANSVRVLTVSVVFMSLTGCNWLSASGSDHLWISARSRRCTLRPSVWCRVSLVLIFSQTSFGLIWPVLSSVSKTDCKHCICSLLPRRRLCVVGRTSDCSVEIRLDLSTVLDVAMTSILNNVLDAQKNDFSLWTSL